MEVIAASTHSWLTFIPFLIGSLLGLQPLLIGSLLGVQAFLFGLQLLYDGNHTFQITWVPIH
jgi:hypothetical protein